MARSVAATHGDKGAMIISMGENGVRIGVDGLTPTELREALCVAINYTFVFENPD